MIKVEKIVDTKYPNNPNTVYVGDFKTHVEDIFIAHIGKKSSTIVLGHHSDGAGKILEDIKPPNLLLDDVNFKQNSKASKLQQIAS